MTADEVRADEARALEEIVARYRALAAQCDGVLAVGTDYAGVSTAGELEFNARVALNLGLPALLVVSGHGRSAEEVLDAIAAARASVGLRGRGRDRQPRARRSGRRGGVRRRACPSTRCRRSTC